MNRIKALIAAGALVATTAATSLPAQAAEYYVVHPNGRITKEYSHPNHGYSYFSFSLGAPVIWLHDSYRHQHHHWARGWRAEQREHRRYERYERYERHESHERHERKRGHDSHHRDHDRRGSRR